MIKMLLNSVMCSDELWIGPIAPLSVYTATEVCALFLVQLCRFDRTFFFRSSKVSTHTIRS